MTAADVARRSRRLLQTPPLRSARPRRAVESDEQLPQLSADALAVAERRHELRLPPHLQAELDRLRAAKAAKEQALKEQAAAAAAAAGSSQ